MPKVVEPVWVAGFEVPEDVHYHQGHTWARAVGPDTVAVGMDDFATRLTGPAHRLEVPDAGSWVQQGDDAFRVDSNGRSAHLVSPVDGEVVEVVHAAAEAIVGSEKIISDERTMGSEDAAYFMQDVPGCYFFVGSANAERGLNAPHHNPRFDIDEGALPLAVATLIHALGHYLL